MKAKKKSARAKLCTPEAKQLLVNILRENHPKQADAGDKRCAFAVSHHCSSTVGDDEWCSGCSFYVCEDCDKTEPWGPHDVMDHREDLR